MSPQELNMTRNENVDKNKDQEEKRRKKTGIEIGIIVTVVM